MYAKKFEEVKYELIRPILEKLPKLNEGERITSTFSSEEEMTRVRYLYYEWMNFHPEEKFKYRLKILSTTSFVITRLHTTPSFKIEKDEPLPEHLSKALDKLIIGMGHSVEIEETINHLLKTGQIKEEDIPLLKREFTIVMS